MKFLLYSVGENVQKYHVNKITSIFIRIYFTGMSGGSFSTSLPYTNSVLHHTCCYYFSFKNWKGQKHDYKYHSLKLYFVYYFKKWNFWWYKQPYIYILDMWYILPIFQMYKNVHWKVILLQLILYVSIILFISQWIDI